MRDKYFKFLLSECKRFNIAPLTDEALNKFIDSKAGIAGLKSFSLIQQRIDRQRNRKPLETIVEELDEVEQEEQSRPSKTI